jgi:hypothetical protein
LLREALDAQETRGDSREISLGTDGASLETLQEEDVSAQQGTLQTRTQRDSAKRHRDTEILFIPGELILAL